MLKHLENENFDEEIKEGIVLVDFYAEWCGPCKMLGPELEDISNNGFKIIKVDVDNHEDLARRYGIMSVPTMMIFKDNEVVNRLVGFMPGKAIMEEIEKIK